MSLQFVFLCLLTAHLLGDFAFQTSRQVEGKNAGRLRAYASHGMVHLVLAVGVLFLFLPEARSRWALYAVALCIALAHVGVDWLKDSWLGRWLPHDWVTFLMDQALHLLILFIAAAFFIGADLGDLIRAAETWVTDHAERILGVAVCYLAVVFGGGYLIRVILSSVDFHESSAEDNSAEDASAEDNGEVGQERLGMYIGWLERAVVVTALLAGSPALVGLVVTAKAVIRFREAEPHFAEYFLLGTFLSLILAGAGGIWLRWWLLGEPTFND